MKAHARPDRPKVLRAIARLNIGGPARHAVILSGGLDALGFDSVLVHGTPSVDEGSFDALAAARGVRTIHIPGFGRRIHAWSDVTALWSMLRIVFRERPDIIHTHTAKAGALGRAAGMIFNLFRPRSRRAMLVHTFHGHVLTGYFGVIGNALTRLTERLLGRWTDAVVTISVSQYDDITRRFAIVPSERAVVVPLGLELDDLLTMDAPDRSLRTASGWGDDHFVAGFVGRLVPVKDVATLLEGFAQFARSCQRARLLVVGDGVLRADLEQLAVSRGLSSLIRFIGWHQDLRQVYGALDATVLTSINEGTPVAIIEALAAGLPVIATAVGGVPDVIEEGQTGLLIPPRDPEAVSCALGRVAADPEWARTLGAAGRRQVRRRFVSDRLVTDIASLYTQLLEKRDRQFGTPATPR